jgi:hypothetical protein
MAHVSKALLASALLTWLTSLISAASAQVTPPAEPIHLDQGWKQPEWDWWYTTTQGSRLLPQSWILELEQAGSSEKFLSEANVRRFGYLSYPANGTGLPLGFAVDKPDANSEPWAGMTCAACHTGDITYRGSRIRIDGAPTQADFQTFMESLLLSLQTTRKDPLKFERFVNAVLGTAASAQDKAKLKSDFDTQLQWYTQLAAKNAGKNGALIRYGHARLDAQGHILNKISLVVDAKQQDPDFPSDAPASYPFLWFTPQQTRVQWNGLVIQGLPGSAPGVEDFDVGALIRNTVEVIGVFASVDVHPAKSYPSSLRFDKILALEKQVKTLKPPKWPETIFPKIDAELKSKGEQVYKDNHCGDCHQVFDSPNPPDKITIDMKPLQVIGTDIWLACNAYLHHSKSGLLEGRQRSPFDSTPITPDDLTFNLVTNISFEMIRKYVDPETPASAKFVQPQTLAPKRGMIFSRLPAYAPVAATSTLKKNPVTILDAGKEQRRKACLAASLTQTEDNWKNLGYEPRPLYGIWATAPYLHNGSVPTLYDLLLPEKDRPQTFTVGGTEFDPDKVGYKSGPGDGPFEFHVRDAYGKPILGNDNAGHEWGTNLNEVQRRQLVEYLKSL